MRSVFQILLVVFVTGLLASCTKNDIKTVDPPGPIPLTPEISAFTIRDYCTRKITITGSSFETDKAKDSVTFAGVKGAIDSVTATHIYAVFPTGVLSGSIKVYCNGKSAVSAQNFSSGPPVIASINPATAGPGTVVTIKGQNFNADAASDSVFFHGIKGTVITAADTQILVKVPQGASTGNITVYSNCNHGSSSTPFTFSNKGIVYATGNTGYCYAIDIASGAMVWSVFTNSGFFNGPTYDNGVIYTGSSDVNTLSNNYMYALDALTGTEIWRYQAGPFDGIPVINNGVLYGGGFDKKLYAWNAVTGEKLWDFTAGEYFRAGGPMYYNGNIYARNDDGYFYCLNATNGSVNWRQMIWPGGNSAAANNIVYTAGSGMFFALNAATGDTTWMRAMSYLSGPSPTIVNDVVYMASENHQVYALQAATGDIIWQKEASWWVASGLFVAGNILYVHSGDGVLTAMDIATGNTIWQRYFPETGFAGTSPVVANDYLFIGDNGGVLNALDAKTGATLWTFSTGGYPIMSSQCVVDAAGRVYHGGDSGNQQ